MLFTNYMPGPNNGYRRANDIWGGWSDQGIASDWLYSKWAVMYGYQMETMSFGLTWSRSSEAWKYSYTDYEEEGTEAYTTIGLGFRMDINDDLTAEIAFDYTMITDTYKETDELDRELDPGKAMALRARGFYKWSDEITFVPYINWSTKDIAQAENDDYTPYGGAVDTRK
jgi:hypothetical protein